MTTREACIQALKETNKNYVLPEEGQEFPIYCPCAIPDSRFAQVVGLAKTICGATTLEVAITMATCGYEPYMGLANFLIGYLSELGGQSSIVKLRGDYMDILARLDTMQVGKTKVLNAGGFVVDVVVIRSYDLSQLFDAIREFGKKF